MERKKNNILNRRINKASLIALMCVLVSIILSICVYAEDSTQNEIISSIKDELKEFQNSLPDNVKDSLPKELFEGDFTALINGGIDEKNFIDMAISYLFAGIDDVLKSFVSMLCVILIASVFNIMQNTFSSDALKSTFSMFSALCISLTIFNICLNLGKGAVYYMNILCNVMTSFAPIMTAIYIMKGSISSAAVSNASMLLFISVVESFLLVGLLPIVKICMCFTLVSSISGSCNLSGITKIIKNTFTSVIVFTMSVFSFVFSYKSIITQSADSLSLRTARFAIGSLIPIVGSSINDALRTVSSSLDMIKNSCGIVAIIVIAVLVLPIIMSLLLNKLSFGLCAGIASLIGCEKESKMIEEANSLCGFILAMVCCTAVLFIFAITVFIKSSTGV